MVIRRILSICIPTWDRAQKLSRLLETLVSQINLSRLDKIVEVIVADNGSRDNTAAVCARFANHIRSIRHAQNIGFDRNCLSLFEHADTPYVLFFSDDDLPRPELLPIVVGLIQQYEPSVLLYSFIQPPHDSVNTSLPIQKDLEIVTDIEHALSMLIRYPKLTTFCLRRTGFNNADFNEIRDSKDGTGYLFVSLAAKAFLIGSGNGLLLHRKPLAFADEESLKNFRFSPLVYSRRRHAVDFPEFWQKCPHVLLSIPEDALLEMLRGAFQHEIGSIVFESSVRREIDTYLRQNKRKFLHPRYFKYLILYFGAVLSRRIGVHRQYAKFVHLSEKILMFYLPCMRNKMFRKVS